MKIGIIGGSFDPIHFGHLVMAEDLREKKKLDRVIFIPTGVAPHKKYQNSGKTRLDMVNLAIEDNEKFLSCDIEINKSEVTYTVDTLRELNKQYPECEFYFIIGLDNLFDLKNWERVEQLGKLTKFLVSSRIYGNIKDREEIKNESITLQQNLGLDIEIIDSPIIEISSSMIRKKVKSNKSIRYLTPRKVLEYINENKLYR